MSFLGFGQGEDGRIFADCIKGIPHIILVGPDGKILEKDMRHEELTVVLAKFMCKRAD